MLDCHVGDDVMRVVALACHPDPKPASAHTPAAPNHKPMSKLELSNWIAWCSDLIALSR